MAVSYKKLWKLLIDKDMKKKDLCEKAGISPGRPSPKWAGTPCHHRDSPENLHCAGLRYRGYYGDCTG